MLGQAFIRAEHRDARANAEHARSILVPTNIEHTVVRTFLDDREIEKIMNTSYWLKRLYALENPIFKYMIREYTEKKASFVPDPDLLATAEVRYKKHLFFGGPRTFIQDMDS